MCQGVGPRKHGAQKVAPHSWICKTAVAANGHVQGGTPAEKQCALIDVLSATLQLLEGDMVGGFLTKLVGDCIQLRPRVKIPQVAPEGFIRWTLHLNSCPPQWRQDGTLRGPLLLNYRGRRPRSARRLAQVASMVAPSTGTFFNENWIRCLKRLC